MREKRENRPILSWKTENSLKNDIFRLFSGFLAPKTQKQAENGHKFAIFTSIRLFFEKSPSELVSRQDSESNQPIEMR